MKRSYALTLLGLSPDALDADARERFAERYAELRQRLENAPDATRKVVYRKKLDELESARTVLFDLPRDRETPRPDRLVPETRPPAEPPERAKVTGVKRKPISLRAIGLGLTLSVAAIAGFLIWRQREQRADEALMTELLPLREAGNYRDAARVALDRGSPAVIRRLQEACEIDAEGVRRFNTFGESEAARSGKRFTPLAAPTCPSALAR